jgi:hypothetical protein
VGEETAANTKRITRLQIPVGMMEKIFVPLAPSLSPPGGERVATGRVRGLIFLQKQDGTFTGWSSKEYYPYG